VLRRLKARPAIVVGLVIGGGFYFLLIDTTSLPELYVLAGVALACGVGFELAREQRFIEARIIPWWLLRSWRLIWRIPSDIALVCWEALVQLVRPRPRRGVFRATAFAATKETPADTGRRALAETVGSFAPNTIIVGVDTERGLLLTHQLRRHGPPEDLDVTRLG
jgi:hypothetical protein